MSRILEWIVTAEESGFRLSAFLSQRLEGKYSAKFLKRLIEKNACQINGRAERFASTPLTKGDHVSFRIEEIEKKPDKMEPQRILYEDDTLFVYNKPPAINSDERGILHLLKLHDQSLELVHRLDRDTTGVLILSKSATALDHLIEQFKQKEVYKRYRVIVDGIVAEPEGVIENFLGRKKAYAGQTLWGAVSRRKGSYAYTEWHRVRKGRNATLITCIPKTGRTHQIRVHMAEMGHPILGDFQYGKRFQCDYRPPRYLLHAEEIQLHHPLTGKRLHFVAPLPDDFKLAEQKLFKRKGS